MRLTPGFIRLIHRGMMILDYTVSRVTSPLSVGTDRAALFFVLLALLRFESSLKRQPCEQKRAVALHIGKMVQGVHREKTHLLTYHLPGMQRRRPSVPCVVSSCRLPVNWLVRPVDCVRHNLTQQTYTNPEQMATKKANTEVPACEKSIRR